MTTVNFIPSGFNIFFPNIILFSIYNHGLKFICRKDLSQFKNLETLNLSGNELTTLPDDLFEDTPKLNNISFYNNKIEFMSSKLFQPIINNNFVYVNFQNNTKINALYWKLDSNSLPSFADLLKLIDAQCSKPESSKTSSPPEED